MATKRLPRCCLRRRDRTMARIWCAVRQTSWWGAELRRRRWKWTFSVSICFNAVPYCSRRLAYRRRRWEMQRKTAKYSNCRQQNSENVSELLRAFRWFFCMRTNCKQWYEQWFQNSVTRKCNANLRIMSFCMKNYFLPWKSSFKFPSTHSRISKAPEIFPHQVLLK